MRVYEKTFHPARHKCDEVAALMELSKLQSFFNLSILWRRVLKVAGEHKLRPCDILERLRYTVIWHIIIVFLLSSLTFLTKRG